MNYCIINGKKSTMIKGLMIQSLPPFTKPLMRTRIEEIDGRDGDIVTKLGYSAYTKEMSIGLFGDFDISEVIEYFNSEGQIIFSNELDKYYKFKIIDQIDYERLAKFRQATVKFHVQPFKYSTVSEEIPVYSMTLREKTVFNRGNVYSRPTIALLIPQQTFVLTLNGEKSLTINAPTDNFGIVIDLEKMNAYNNDRTAYLNRYVSGNLEDFVFKPRENVLTWSDRVDPTKDWSMGILNYSRWI